MVSVLLFGGGMNWGHGNVTGREDVEEVRPSRKVIHIRLCSVQAAQADLFGTSNVT